MANKRSLNNPIQNAVINLDPTMIRAAFDRIVYHVSKFVHWFLSIQRITHSVLFFFFGHPVFI